MMTNYRRQPEAEHNYRFIEKKRVKNVTVLNPFQSSNYFTILSQDLHQNNVDLSLFTKVPYD